MPRGVEVAGRVCYMSFGQRQRRRRNEDYIANLIAQGHDSVLEHANFTMLIEGVSRAFSHQLVRHRIGFAYSQLSQQYHDESDAEFVEPALLAQHPETRQRWKRYMDDSRAAYRALLDDVTRDAASLKLTPKERQRLARSIARSVLPNATATALMVTGNARAWRHLLAVRGAIAGDLEMREYCAAVFETLVATAPNLVGDFELADDPLGRWVRSRRQPSRALPS